MRIAIVGAGIGGLTAAGALIGDGHEVIVAEQRTAATAIGAGLTLFGNAMGALDAVGLGDCVRAVSSDEVARLRAGQQTPDGSWLTLMPTAMVPSIRSVLRAELHNALLSELPPATVQFGTRAEVSADGSPVVAIDGEEQQFDLVIAADGLRSPARERLGLDRGVHYAGFTAWRGVTSSPVAVDAAGETWGAGSLFGSVPLPGGCVYWFATQRCPAGRAAEYEHAAVSERFASWHAPIRELLEATPPEAVMRHDIYDLAALPPSFVKARTVLLGDAAHAMTPNLGQGAGQGIEDAATLTLLLRSGHRDLDAALARYSELRRARTKTIWQRSRLMGRVAHASNPLAIAARNALLRATPAATISKTANQLAQWQPPVASDSHAQ